MPNNNTLKWRVGELEKDISSIRKDLKKIMTNELPHIKEDILKLGSKVDIRSTEVKTRVNVATSINVGAIIIALLLAKYL